MSINTLGLSIFDNNKESLGIYIHIPFCNSKCKYCSFVSMVASEEDKKIMTEFNVDSSAASNMVNNFNFIKELKCWAFSSYDEKNEIYKINIRSRGPVINIVAQKYNGGGHMYASGARIELESDVDKLFNDLDNATKEYKNRIEN